MKRFTIATIALSVLCLGSIAQVEKGSVRKRDRNEKTQNQGDVMVSERMQSFYEAKEPHDADLAYTRTIYRQLDLNKEANQPLYFPEDVVDGKQNLFRVMLNLVVSGAIPAYEYLDGREAFTDDYQIKVNEMLDRYGIYYQESGSGKGAKYTVQEADVPTTQVQNYYIRERWDFDKRANRMTTRVEAICPVLNRYGDFGGESKYPMFWVKFDALRPYLAQQYVFLSDDNNLEQFSLDDYFNMGMYQGDIYKTKNLRNLSMMQMYPNEDDLKHAQDSIDNRLNTFGKNLWVPTREEYLAQKEAEEARAAALAAGDTITERTDENATELRKANARAKRTTAPKANTKKRAKVKKSPALKASANNNAEKSVRRRKK